MSAPVIMPGLQPSPPAAPAAKRTMPLAKRLLLVALAVTGGAAAGAGIAIHQRHASVSLADIMSISPLPARLSPGFTLTAEDGHKVSLAQYRGKAVVIEFMDPRCTDICPIVSQELRLADQRLGVRAADVEFLAINVNQYHEDVASVRRFTDEQRLGQLPNWHFLTGSTTALRAQWASYGETVEPNPSGDVVHSSFMYFVDPTGHQRYLATPMSTTTYLSQWGQGIAHYAASLVEDR